MGCPCSARYESGIPEVVAEGESGLLVRESDPDALAAGLEQLLARSAEWPVIGRRGRDHIARNYDLATSTIACSLYTRKRLRASQGADVKANE